jgi:hypothetical protein
VLRSTLHFSNRPVVAATLFFFLLVPLAAAQLNWEGQTGGLITPFAYTSSSSMGLGRPQLALHYLNGGGVLGNDFQVSITAGFLKIAEGGFTRTFNILGNDELAPLFANGFNTAHIKFRVMPENAWHSSFVPALAAGAIVRTQVRRVTEVSERENTTATDFFLVGTKTIANIRVPIVLNLGVKLTNASIFGIAANSPGWEVKPFGGLFVAFKAPLHSRLTLGAEFARQPRQLKEVPGTVVPTTLSYLIRWRPGSDVPLTLELGMVQLGNNLGSGFDMEAKHQLIIGASYHF